MFVETDKMPFEATVQVALHVLEGFNSPRSLAVYMLADAYLIKNYEPMTFSLQLDSLHMNLNCYDQFSIDAFRDDYCSTNLLTKLPPKDAGDAVLSDTALTAFQDAEHVSSRLVTELWCNLSKVSNRLGDILGDNPINTLRSCLFRVLGRAPSLRNVVNRSYFSEGASLGLSARKSSAAAKCVSECYITPDLARALSATEENGESIFDLHPLWKASNKWFLSPGNLVSTVPKNIKTDRTIAIEPEINQFVQRGIGDIIAARLQKQGIDLQNQGNNQAGALHAISRKLATIDLKNASNSMNAMVMMSLLPSDWWELISVSRSPYWTVSSRADIKANKAQWSEYHMLSSMGNGYTFELESALFYAVCLACGVPDYDILVYGDDIIIPQSNVSTVQHVLSVLGFEMNIEKSFISGTFFESCGLYSFHGVDVTPFKIKDLLLEDKDCIVLANKIRWFSHCCNGYSSCDRRLLPAYRLCTHRISRYARMNCRGPFDGSLLLWSNVDEVKPVYSKKRCGFRISRLSPSNNDRTRLSTHPGLLSYRLFELEKTNSVLYVEDYANTLSHRDRARYDDRLNQIAQYRKVRRGNVVKAEVGKFSVITCWLETRSWYEPGRWV